MNALPAMNALNVSLPFHLPSAPAETLVFALVVIGLAFAAVAILWWTLVFALRLCLFAWHGLRRIG